MKYVMAVLLLSALALGQLGGGRMCEKDASIPDMADGLVKIEPLTADEAAQLDAARKARDEAQHNLNALVKKLKEAHGECGQYWMEWQAGRSVDIDGHFALIRKWHRGMGDTFEVNVQ